MLAVDVVCILCSERWSLIHAEWLVPQLLSSQLSITVSGQQLHCNMRWNQWIPLPPVHCYTFFAAVKWISWCDIMLHIP